MKVYVLFACFALLVLRGLTYGDGQTAIRHTTKSNEPWNARHIRHEDVSLMVVVPSMNKHGNIPLNVILANRSREDYLSGVTGYFLDCQIRLKTDAGKHIAYSKLGHNLFSGEITDRKQYAIVKLSSGTTRSWEFNITKAFSPLAPGRYKLSLETTVSLHTGQVGEREIDVTLVADEIPFQVQ